MEVELSTDELCAFVSRLEAQELALDDLLDLVLNVALGCLIEFEIAVCIFWLASIASSMASKRRHFVRVPLQHYLKPC